MANINQIELMQSLEHMTELPGWKATEAEIIRRRDDALARLRKCPIEDVVRYREIANTCESILNFVTDRIEAGKKAMRSEYEKG